MHSGLKGLTVLLLEDESMVAMLTEDILLEQGCDVLLAMRLEDGLKLARDAAFDLAVLDVNLGGGETSYPIAGLLLDRGIPFLFATGYHAGGMDPRFEKCPKIQKPFTPIDLVKQARQTVFSAQTT